jgi:hypothetical protein
MMYALIDPVLAKSFQKISAVRIGVSEPLFTGKKVDRTALSPPTITPAH